MIHSRKRLFILAMIVLLAATINPSLIQAQAESTETFPLSIIDDPSTLISSSMNAETRSDEDTDVFGYTRVAPTAYNWIDTSSGTDTGINFDTVKYAGPIPIGFAFDYYENNYTELYISVYGYVSFNDENLTRSQPGSIPSIEPPNDVIAPLWTVAESINYVRYQTLGISPNRQFVIEWNQFTTDSGSNQYTFEVILHENGDITFQYAAMSDFQEGYSRYAGIENSRGDDGLEAYANYTGDFLSNTAEKFIRPADHANPILTPPSQGDTMAPGEAVAYIIDLRNYGAVGTDTYTISTQSEWSIELFEGDGSTPLSNPITLDQGDHVSFIAEVTAPIIVTPTETNIAQITATSGVTPTINNTVQIINTFPAPFVQFIDYDSDDGVQTSLNMRPNGLSTTDFTSEGVEGDTAVISLPNHNVFYAWVERICIGEYCNDYDAVIKYTILDPYGSTVLAPTVLVDVTTMENDVRDYSMFLASTPDGDIGILWKREIYNRDNYISNYNAFFAILSQDGLSFTLAPQQLTSNDVFCPFWESSCIDQQHLKLAGTPNGNFFMLWREDPSTNYVFKIFSDSEGTLSPTYSLVNAASEEGSNSQFTLTGLDNNNYFVAWNYEDLTCDGDDCIWETELRYTVIDSSASVAFPQTSIADIWLSDPDSVQLSNGNIILAHDNLPNTSFMLFDGTTYAPLTPMTLIPGQEESWSPGTVSVIKGPYGTAVLTLGNHPEEEDVWEMVYMLIDSDGTVKTPPLTFFESGYDSSGIYNYLTSDSGQGSTPLYYDYTPIFTSEPVTSGYREMPYSYPVTTDDGNLPEDTLTITVVTKPDWLSFVDNGDGTATLSGNPALAGNYSVILRVEDINGNREDQTFEIEVTEVIPTFLPLFLK